jgi:hypothetical protein
MIGRKGRDGTSGDPALPAGSDPTLTLLKTAASTGAAILYVCILTNAQRSRQFFVNCRLPKT